MSMLDRVKNAVLGNPVEREYEIGKHIASAGPQLQWKIHQGTRKSTQKAVSIFIFSKKTPQIEKMDKRSREKLFEAMRRGPQQLAKLRHPLLLTIDHSLEETRDMLVFVTEPVQCSVSNVLGNYTNIPQPLPFAIKNFEMDDIEIRIGMLGILGGLQFLHNDAKLVHGNVTPESVVVVQSGAWKLAGFHFHAFLRYQQQQGVEVPEFDSKAVISEPNLDYLSPERVMQKTIDTSADIWSYAMLLYTVYNKGQLPATCNGNLLTYQQNVETISRMSAQSFPNIPVDVRDHLKMCLSMEGSLRPDALACSKITFYNDNRLQVLQYLETLMQRPDLEKSQFFKNLHRVLGKMPKRVQLNRILPSVFSEFIKPTMIPFALPNVLMIAKECTLDEYCVHVWPSLKGTFTIQEPIQIMLLLLQKMDLLLTKTPQHDIKAHILPMIYRALESQNQVIQELVVTILPNFASMVDYSSLKHQMVPRVTNLCLSTTFLKIRVNSLVCIGRILEHMDKWMVQELVVPVLHQIPSREAGVLMAILGIYKEILNNKKLGLEKMQIATVVLPFLIPLSVELSLNAHQFGTYMSVIREMLQAVDTEHMSHLKEEGQMQEEVASSLQHAADAEEARAMDDMIGRMEGMFAAPAVEPTPTPAPAAPATSAEAAPAIAPFGIAPLSAAANNGAQQISPLQPPPSATTPTDSGGIISASGPTGPSLDDIFGDFLDPIPSAAPVGGALDQQPFAAPLMPTAVPTPAPAPAPALSWSSGLQQHAAVEKHKQDEEKERERKRLEEERRKEEEQRRVIQEQQRQEAERKRQEQQRRQEEERRKQEEEKRRQQQEQQRLQQQQQQQQQQQGGMQGSWSSTPMAPTTSGQGKNLGWSSGLQSQGMATSNQPTSNSSTSWSSSTSQPQMQPQPGFGSQPLQPQQNRQQGGMQPMQPTSGQSNFSQPMQPAQAQAGFGQQQQQQQQQHQQRQQQQQPQPSGFGQQPMQPSSGFGQPTGAQPQQGFNASFGQQPPQQQQQQAQGFNGSLGQQRPQQPGFNAGFGQQQPPQQQRQQQQPQQPQQQQQQAQGFNGSLGQQRPQQPGFNAGFGQQQPPQQQRQQQQPQQHQQYQQNQMGFNASFGQQQQKQQDASAIFAGMGGGGPMMQPTSAPQPMSGGFGGVGNQPMQPMKPAGNNAMGGLGDLLG